VAEAMSLELPVLATTVSGIPEIIEDGKDGFLVESQDAEAMADKLIEMIESPALLETVRKAGRLKVKSMFESKELIFELSDLLERSIAKKIDLDKFYLKPKSL
jgi:glycosyltransferase involved in cell wall biosynthesis